MIEVDTLYVGRTDGRNSAKFARLSEYTRIGGGVWATRSISEGGPRFYYAQWMHVSLCQTTEFSRRTWSAGIPRHWTSNVHTDRFWTNNDGKLAVPILAWKFIPDDATGTLVIEFCNFSGHPVLRHNDVPLHPVQPFNH